MRKHAARHQRFPTVGRCAGMVENGIVLGCNPLFDSISALLAVSVSSEERSSSGATDIPMEE